MKYTWWILQIVMTLLSIFFLIFGIDLMRAAYLLTDPFSFIMTFFAASFVILISLALCATSTIKMIRVYKKIKTQE